MRRNGVCLFFVCTLGLVLGLSSTGFSAEEFSAEVVNIAGDQRFEGKVYIAAERMRMETPEAVTITRMDQKKIWVLMPQQRMYLEQSFNAASLLATSEKLPGEIERTLMGEELVNGKLAKKYRVVYRHDNRQESVLQWYIPEFAMPVKIAAGDGSWVMEYRNIKVGRQQESLFELPAGYKKFSPDLSSLSGMAEGLQ